MARSNRRRVFYCPDPRRLRFPAVIWLLAGDVAEPTGKLLVRPRLWMPPRTPGRQQERPHGLLGVTLGVTSAD